MRLISGKVFLALALTLVGSAVFWWSRRQPQIHGRWADPVAVKVTLHRFETPPNRENFSLVQGFTFDERTLRRREVESATLTPDQTARLKRALVSGRRRKLAAC